MFLLSIPNTHKKEFKFYQFQKYKSKLKQLNLPEYSFRIREEKGSELIFDQIRKKWVKLTPEEWVRQNFIQYLIQEGKYPAGLIGVEVNFRLFNLNKRVDILIHSRNGEPVMIVECKAPEIRISDFYEDSVYNQLGEYNFGFRVPYVIVTNGMLNYAFRFNPELNRYEHLLEIPYYADLINRTI